MVEKVCTPNTFCLVSKTVDMKTYELHVWRYFDNYENPKNMVKNYQVKASSMDNLRKRIIHDVRLDKMFVVVYRVKKDGSLVKMGTVQHASKDDQLLWTTVGKKITHHKMKKDGTLYGRY